MKQFTGTNLAIATAIGISLGFGLNAAMQQQTSLEGIRNVAVGGTAAVYLLGIVIGLGVGSQGYTAPAVESGPSDSA